MPNLPQNEFSISLLTAFSPAKETMLYGSNSIPSCCFTYEKGLDQFRFDTMLSYLVKKQFLFGIIGAPCWPSRCFSFDFQELGDKTEGVSPPSARTHESCSLRTHCQSQNVTQGCTRFLSCTDGLPPEGMSCSSVPPHTSNTKERQVCH